MASYQEIETRLSVLEDQVKFVMNNMRGTLAVPTGLVNEQGQPTVRVKQMSLYDLYLVSKSSDGNEHHGAQRTLITGA